ncbi:expressed unknown protein [Seminavis robusta]|uniref:Uncharacterized protein n=1 Tax=Seminavis robusta TaxID=568900 RepID=A0A9N8DPM4_9STRA|nr:expressed unknown protein [Seminavis robusta]|eukprot:Sro280_g107060.1 n/a (207) ;mRNA; r:49273-49893
MTGIPLFIVIPSDFASQIGRRNIADDSDSLSESAWSLSSSASTRWLSCSTRDQDAPTTSAPPRRPQRHCSQRTFDPQDMNLLQDLHITDAQQDGIPQPPPLRKAKSDFSPRLPRRSSKPARSAGHGPMLPSLRAFSAAAGSLIATMSTSGSDTTTEEHEKENLSLNVPRSSAADEPSRRRKSEPAQLVRRPLPRPSRSALAIAMAA